MSSPPPFMETPDIGSILVICITTLIIVLVQLLVIAALAGYHILFRLFQRPHAPDAERQRPNAHDIESQTLTPEAQQHTNLPQSATQRYEDLGDTAVMDYDYRSPAASSLYSVPTPPLPARHPAREARPENCVDLSSETLFR
ncbi:hypothetical protein EK21DRAFT_95144 [Setomelanomma holmii]|uniref:Uncharacterized protein n=1 Tax=Setomelanomma holmii TaxID=210430 RepID=A0A9P4LGG6_9PLEO|nr:hypothetical protein EK21DRAFT_95144 [Setomelanomma holmii]